MKRKAHGVPKISVIIIILCNALPAWDGERNGFVFGFGIGGACDFTKPEYVIHNEKSTGELRVNPALVSDMRFGLHWRQKYELRSVTRIDWQMPYSSVISINTNSIQFTYCLSEPPPSLSFGGGVGYGFWIYPFDTDWNELYNGHGIAFSLNIGLEIQRHVSVQLDYQYFSPVHNGEIAQLVVDSDGNVNAMDQISYSHIYRTNAIRMSICYLFY